MSKNKAEGFKKLARNNFKMKLFMLKDLPLAFIAGLKVLKVTNEECSVSIPYKFLNKNPFKSIYFAAQCMAAELPTGLLALNAVYKSKPSVSMLVLNMEASFTKKATSKVIFTCKDGQKIIDAVEKSKETGEGVTVIASSIGIDKEGDKVAEFKFTWTFKPKKS